jgi:cobalt-zinc-cadmium efflux system outer membrane protein
LLFVEAHAAPAAEAPVWTLDAAVRQALAVAPEIREAEAEVAAREGTLKQAGAWPNPSIDLRADQKLGIQDGSGGTDLTQVAVTQPLPLTRLAPQRAQAEAQLVAARERLRHARLARETETARAFHALQLAQARLTLAWQRVAFVAGLESGTGDKGRRIVRYLTPLERARLAILREAAEQEAAFAEGKYSEAAAQFRALLALTPDSAPQVAALVPAEAPAPLEVLLGRLGAHPALGASDHDIEAARAGIDVARAQRFADPTIGVFRERDFLGGEQRDFSGVMLSVQVPLWNTQAGNVARARAETDQAREHRAATHRDLETRLRQGRLHLGHLIEQAERFRERLLGPARRMLDLARRGFATGEQNILALVDAYNTYFDAEIRYHELLQEAWQEAAELRLAAGIALVQQEVTP